MNSPQNSETMQSPDGPAPLCETHGTPMDSWVLDGLLGAIAPALGTSGWSCATCDAETARKAEIEAHQQFDDRRLAAMRDRKQAEIEARIGAAGIPARYRDHSFDTFPPVDHPGARRACTVLRSFANRWLSVAPRGISGLLLGGAGTGKTGLACSVANKIMRDDRATALFMSAYGAVRHQRDTWGRKGRTEREALDDLLNVDLLILDEIGASVGTDFEMTCLFEVINGRYAARKPTFLLSNLPMGDYEHEGRTLPGLRTFLGPRVVDRFRDDGSFTLAFDWPSLRGATA